MSDTSYINDDPLLINLKTGELWEVDQYALIERGMPEGFTLYSNLTPQDISKAIMDAKDD